METDFAKNKGHVQNRGLVAFLIEWVKGTLTYLLTLIGCTPTVTDTPPPSEFGSRPLEDRVSEVFRIISSGDVDRLRQLASCGQVDPDLKDVKGSGDTLLHIACGSASKRSAEIAGYLLAELKSDPNVKNGQGLTPLHIACARGDTRLINVLMSNGADPTVHDEGKGTPLFWAVWNGKNVSVDVLTASWPCRSQDDIDAISLTAKDPRTGKPVTAVELAESMDTEDMGTDMSEAINFLITNHQKRLDKTN